MDIGKLDRRIRIFFTQTSVDSFGQAVNTNSIFQTIWAQKIDVVKAVSELENQGMQEQTKYVSRFIIRWRSDINAKMRIEYEGKKYEITQIAEIGRREGLELVCVRTETANYD